MATDKCRVDECVQWIDIAPRCRLTPYQWGIFSPPAFAWMRGHE
jgi:hypothetical protein